MNLTYRQIRDLETQADAILSEDGYFAEQADGLAAANEARLGHVDAIAWNLFSRFEVWYSVAALRYGTPGVALLAVALRPAFVAHAARPERQGRSRADRAAATKAIDKTLCRTVKSSRLAKAECKAFTLRCAANLEAPTPILNVWENYCCPTRSAGRQEATA